MRLGYCCIFVLLSFQIICLQEVDHFDLLERALDSVGYSGRFLAKPDSPCIYMEGNTGPDGEDRNISRDL